MKKIILRLCATVVMVFCGLAAWAQDSLGLAQVADFNIDSPAALTSDASVFAILSVVTAALAYFSKLFPVLGNITEVKVRAYVLAFTVVLGAIKFRLGFFVPETLPFLGTTVLALLTAFGVSGGAGLLYDLIRWATGGRIKTLN